MPQTQTPRQPVTLPNFNYDNEVHDLAETAGAYIGGAVTAGITGLFNLGAGLIRGAMGGAVNTYQCGALDEARKAEAQNGGHPVTEADVQEFLRWKQSQNQG